MKIDHSVDFLNDIADVTVALARLLRTAKVQGSSLSPVGAKVDEAFAAYKRGNFEAAQKALDESKSMLDDMAEMHVQLRESFGG